MIRRGMFQSTHSRRVRHVGSAFYRNLQSFNPRTHEECDAAKANIESVFNVSIHALTKSATCQQYKDFRQDIVSIHALTKSATGCQPKHLTFKHCFNPRTHEECDRCLLFFRHSWTCFNPRTHEECDFPCIRHRCISVVSIHALTKSATWTYVGIPAFESFNPRTHEECDRFPSFLSPVFNVSIHALTKSATNSRWL